MALSTLLPLFPPKIPSSSFSLCHPWPLIKSSGESPAPSVTESIRPFGVRAAVIQGLSNICREKSLAMPRLGEERGEVGKGCLTSSCCNNSGSADQHRAAGWEDSFTLAILGCGHLRCTGVIMGTLRLGTCQTPQLREEVLGTWDNGRLVRLNT